ncbi:hypothetical protein L9F63_019738 [Diploptera punctata]|uniref:EB domain-containing protein n=1 Tax=Diploptera punctata TaxID=6984 RepID=A0AAD7ZTN3_DIPPU|nr:hypothetical protein L9F63_019738 [Diploptera punctata]
MMLATIAMLAPAVFGFHLDVTVSNTVVGNINTTDQDRACWQDSDCVTYPFCRRQPSNCRCLQTGSCLVVRSYGQHCSSSTNCANDMQCQNVFPQPANSRLRGVCRCESGARYSRQLNQCLRVSPSIGVEMPRFADLPDPGGEDADAPEEIPPTYGGAILVGLLSLGLVLLCLGLSFCCHYSSTETDNQSNPTRPSVDEKIPLDMFVPPPEMYQTPGFQNYSTMNDGIASTSRTHESLGMLGAELSRTLR